MSIASPPPFVNDIGVDVSKADFWAAVDRPDRDLHKLTAKKFPRTEQGARKFLEWARSLIAPEAAIRVVMEATGLYSEQLADLLLQIDPACRAVIANPRAVSEYAASHTDTKTDQSDARVLARFGQGRRLRDYVPLPADQRPLRAMVRQRKEVVGRISAERQRMKEYEGLSDVVTQSQERVIKALQEEKKTLDREINGFVRKCPPLKRTAEALTKITGVGDTIAAAVLGELGDLARFANNKELTAFVGLKPREHTSGTSVKKQTRMSKRGPRYIRALLYMAAMAAVSQGENRFARQFEQLTQRGMNGKAALGAIMRKILIVMRSVVVSGKPYDDAHVPDCGKPVGNSVENSAA